MVRGIIMSTSHEFWGADVISFQKECLLGPRKFAVDFFNAIQNWDRLQNRDIILDLQYGSFQ